MRISSPLQLLGYHNFIWIILKQTWDAYDVPTVDQYFYLYNVFEVLNNYILPNEDVLNLRPI